MTREYLEPQDEDWLLYAREWEDQRLMSELGFLFSLFGAVTAEVAFRADNPEYRDGTGHIDSRHVELYELSDEVEHYRQMFDPD